MALTQVRVKLGEEWTTLTYNPATGRYEGKLHPAGSSIHQPGGYYPVTVEASNESGETASLTGEQFPGLRLVVREVTAPTLTLIAPAPGFLTTASPVFVFEAADEEGGSGVDLSTAQVTLDGADVPCTVEESGGGYRITLTADGLSEGPHVVTAAVSDYDGNQATVSGAYTVDTVPPWLILRRPYRRHVFDAAEIEVAAEAGDVNGVASLAIGGVEVVGDGVYSRKVPLEVGENHIVVTATDAAGNQSSETVYAIRLVTDRTEADVERVRALLSRPVSGWTADELEWFNAAVVRGAYDDTDLNRVGIAVRFLAAELVKRGYALQVSGIKTDWTKEDAPAVSQMDAYITNVEAVRTTQGLYATEIPPTMRKLTTDGANRIEKALVDVDSVFPRYSAWSAGEISSGGF